MGREPTTKEEDMLERRIRKEKRIQEIGAAKLTPVKIPPKINFTVRLGNPALQPFLPQPAWCSFCREELEDKTIEADASNGQTMRFYRCRGCHTLLGILVGSIIGAEGEGLKKKKKAGIEVLKSVPKFMPRKVDD